MTTITLRYFAACPNWRIAERRLRDVLGELGAADVDLVHERVESPDDAARLGFRGSPTILVDGRDPFPGGGDVGLSCRVYRTEAGTEGAPSLEQLRAALAP
jgi:hypothetical protein